MYYHCYFTFIKRIILSIIIRSKQQQIVSVTCKEVCVNHLFTMLAKLKQNLTLEKPAYSSDLYTAVDKHPPVVT